MTAPEEAAAGDAIPLERCATRLVDPERVDAVRKRMAGEGVSDQLAAVFRMLAEPARVRIVSALLEAGELCVCDLAAVLSLSQSAVSHQLRLLRGMRLVRPRREGRMVFYALDDRTPVSRYEGPMRPSTLRAMLRELWGERRVLDIATEKQTRAMTPAEIVDAYGRAVSSVVTEYASPSPRVDDLTLVLPHAVRDERIEPREDPHVAEWLDVLDPSGALLDWIAYARAERCNATVPALALIGAGSAQATTFCVPDLLMRYNSVASFTASSAGPTASPEARILFARSRLSDAVIANQSATPSQEAPRSLMTTSVGSPPVWESITWIRFRVVFAMQSSAWK